MFFYGPQCSFYELTYERLNSFHCCSITHACNNSAAACIRHNQQISCHLFSIYSLQYCNVTGEKPMTYQTCAVIMLELSLSVGKKIIQPIFIITETSIARQKPTNHKTPLSYADQFGRRKLSNCFHSITVYCSVLLTTAKNLFENLATVLGHIKCS